MGSHHWVTGVYLCAHALGYVDIFADVDRDGTFDPIGGQATIPNSNGSIVLIDKDEADFSSGSLGRWLWIHELGHAVGGFNDVTVGINADTRYPIASEQNNQGIDGQVLGQWQDNQQYTVMSYNPHPYMRGVSPSTLGLYDIAAIQALYGANWSHNAGNNTYSWGRNETFIETIWDGGGNDTINASNQTRRSIINLGAGRFSSIGSLNGVSNALSNLAIAYGVTIENAFGGSGSDSITGNNIGNVLLGLGGNDSIFALGGNDIIYGGTGNDIIYAGAGNDSVYGGAGNDRVYGGTGNDYVVGDSGDDVMAGGAGSDILIGGWGNDTINGTTYVSQGTGERDILTSGSYGDRDTFVLGQYGRVFYNDRGNADYALIRDFDVYDVFGEAADKIQLLGSAASYKLSNVSINGLAGAGIHVAGDLIGLVQNVNAASLNLANAYQFTYV
ncbi:M10 family metallopeptidase C-terminal domain-containing protein [Leptothoe kymatousa]|uniref:M10 family metallopeptidase C-terminal domain-containing protein n=1 Tax=Leptothoe kymatousa TAU-MAC 1615 TaxID=2364775 RepID=A0ABS5Y3L2_9CYAN|nr:M10 family metallopeptidase C-terminal domain-containing protein [Leptothoe kymatousa]MBT9312401.1 M10 family metallopeptidase C-terminal domain-containing protein [Leptothoe kymatousa TAU-MAC 1615]